MDVYGGIRSVLNQSGIVFHREDEFFLRNEAGYVCPNGVSAVRISYFQVGLCEIHAWKCAPREIPK